MCNRISLLVDSGQLAVAVAKTVERKDAAAIQCRVKIRSRSPVFSEKLPVLSGAYTAFLW